MGPIHYDDVPMNWVGDTSRRRAMLTPNAPALYDADADQRLTFAQVDDRANRVGTYLVDELGIKKGDPVCFLGRNAIEPVDMFFAAGKIGAVFSPLSYRLSKRELDDLLHRIGPKAIFYEEKFSSLVETLEFPDTLRARIPYGSRASQYDQQVLGTPARDVNCPKCLNDLFMYVHTGGSTATPKVCMVTHRQMTWNALEMMAIGLGAFGFRELCTFPFFHIGGWNSFNSVFMAGGYAVLTREFNPGQLLELVEREKVHHFGAVEAMLQFIVAHPRFATTDLSSLTHVNSAGAPCSAEVMRPLWERNIPVTQVYGLTEAGPSNFGYIPPDPALEEAMARPGTIGTPMPFCDFEIVDRETRTAVERGQVGVLRLRGAHNFSGYLNDPERTEGVLSEDGWVYSGDLAKQDERGYVYILGRADNMFVSGGENVSPEEIENALRVHPDVVMAVCVGVPDKTWGQVPYAQVTVRAGTSVEEAALRSTCEQELARFKIPRHIDVVSALPLTGAGKLDRNALREQHKQRHGE